MLGTTLLWGLPRRERQPLAVKRWADMPSRYAQAVRAVGAHRVSVFLATRHAAHPSTAFPSGLQSTISAAVKDQWGNLAEDFPAFDLADENRVVTSG